VTEPPPSADAVRAGGAYCIGAEFIDELPAGAPIDVDGAGSGVTVVGPLKWIGFCPATMSGVST
jgi:hypothetical protein